MKSLNVQLVLGCLLILFAGCSGDGKTEFKGVATWNGEPIADGYVEFTPVDGKGQIVGTDIVDGEFKCRTQPGEKTVSITAKKKVGERPATERTPKPMPIYHQYLPEEFNTKTELKTTFDASNPTVELKLTGTDAPERTGLTPEEERRKAMQGGSENR